MKSTIPPLPRAEAIAAFCRHLAAADPGPAIERCCRTIAIAIAITYTAGWLLGTWVHQGAELLAAVARELQQPDWHQQRLHALKARLVARGSAARDPQPTSALAGDPQPQPPKGDAVITAPKRTQRSKLVQPAPKPSRKRQAKGARSTTAAAAA